MRNLVLAVAFGTATALDTAHTAMPARHTAAAAAMSPTTSPSVSLPRRAALLAASALPMQLMAARSNAADSEGSSTSAASKADVQALLSGVPLFVVSNAQGQPYLTQQDSQGRRSGFFHLDPLQAVRELQEIRGFDSSASLVVVPLDSIWFDLPQSAAAAAQSLANSPQPRSGTSSDLRLFSLEPIAAESSSSSAAAAGLKPDEVALFYEPALLLQTADGEKLPYFFRQDDLVTTWESAQTQKVRRKPSVKALSLPQLLTLYENGQLAQPPLLIAASEALAVVDRVGGGRGDGGAPATKEQLIEKLALGTPFGAGARRQKLLGIF